MSDAILTLNVGSSSVKFALFDHHDGARAIARGKVAGLGSQPVLQVDGDKTRLDDDTDVDAGIAHILDAIDRLSISVKAVGHRIVHGGSDYVGPVALTDDILSDLERFCPYAPYHQPYNLAAVRTLRERLPDALHIGAFDTAFHDTLPPLSYTYALPEDLRALGLRRYGFHGLSYEWVAQELSEHYPALAKGRVVAAHLGNGASLCAMDQLQSVATTMGLSALEGLTMGSRSGSLDPGILLYLARERGYSAAAIEEILYTESGLKGLSGIDNDMRRLHESSSPRAAFAIAYFCHRAAEEIARMTVTLGGIDALVFTGGIGENDDGTRNAIVAALDFLPAFETLVMKTDEERVIARHVGHFLPHSSLT